MEATVQHTSGPDSEPTAEQRDRAEQYAAGLETVAAMLRANPEVIDSLTYTFGYMLAPVDTKDELAAIIRAGLAQGAKVRKEMRASSEHAGARVSFGPVSIKAYANREKVCERVVTGTREVTEEVPDPEALAAVPTVQVTKTVEDVEWKCHPLLAEAGA